MKSFKYVGLAALAGLLMAFGMTVTAPRTQAQVSVNVGVAPACPYGYYDYAPYACAPYGYYGPDWFNGGVFIGAGPWFHGPDHFRGHVDNHFDVHHGYHGPAPHTGDRAEAGRELGGGRNFHGNEMRDGHGHEVR